MRNSTRRNLRTIYNAAIEAVLPERAVSMKAGYISEFYRRNNCKRLFVTGFGKGSCRMAKGLEEALTVPVDKGILITKYGHCQDISFNGAIDVYEAGHPVPDYNGVYATEQVVKLLKDSDRDTLIVCLVSGGGSALMVSPFDGISLEEKQAVTEMLLKTDANIGEINAVRKHISSIKGGRFAEKAYPAHIISLILSDVTGDRLDVIASGPTVPDTSTYMDAISVISRVDIIRKVPEKIIETLLKGSEGVIPETPKAEDPIFDNVNNIIIGNNAIAVEAAGAMAESMGFTVHIAPFPLVGEAVSAGAELAKETMDIYNASADRNDKRICIISGGETTVNVRGSGMGGRNTELALAFARHIKGKRGISILSAGTDGMDGTTDAAGAFADGMTIDRAEKTSMDYSLYLENNDSYSFFKSLGDLFVTGPTGTNVMDLQIITIE